MIYGKIKIQDRVLKNVKIQKVNYLDKINVKKFKYQIIKINGGRVFSNFVENVSVISNNILLKKFSFQQINGYLRQDKNQVLSTGTPKFKKKLAGKTLVLTQGASSHFNYSHWLFDVVPKLIMISEFYKLSKIDYFYFSKLNNFQKETLKILKINPDKFIDSNKYRHIEAEKLIAVTHPNYFKKTFFFAHSHLPGWIINSLKNIFLSKRLKKKNYKKIFIDRNDSTENHCKLINNYEVKEFLKKNGFKILQLSKLKIIDQISIFRNCKEIIAPHGAGLANLTFCKSRTKVTELIPENIKNEEYKRVSKLNKLKHKFVYLKNIKDNKIGDMYINLKLLKKFI
tara:strand:- start:280 stop:1302 length:1023 start_codon:yes stop_codon:yes gene_type:complete